MTTMDLMAMSADLAGRMHGRRARRDAGDDWIGPVIGEAMGFDDAGHSELVEALRRAWVREGALIEECDERGVLRVYAAGGCPACGATNRPPA